MPPGSIGMPSHTAWPPGCCPSQPSPAQTVAAYHQAGAFQHKFQGSSQVHIEILHAVGAPAGRLPDPCDAASAPLTGRLPARRERSLSGPLPRAELESGGTSTERRDEVPGRLDEHTVEQEVALSRPQAMTDAVGSLIIRSTFVPEMVPASLLLGAGITGVRWHCHRCVADP